MEHPQRAKWFGWERDLTEELNNGSQVVETASGPIEFAKEGDGPFVVGFHGAPGGYDQAVTLMGDVAQQGFTFLGWSRPGYLRTPLETGKTFEEQADALAHLLDTMQIGQTAIYAVSAGGPAALAFALRHPDRIWGLILECSISKQYSIPPDSNSEKIFTKLMFNDFGMWLWDLFASFSPKSTVRQLISMESSLGPKQTAELLDRVMEDPQKVAYVMNLIKSLCPISLRKAGLKNDLEQVANFPDFPLHTIKTPTLIIHGTADADVPIAHSEYAAASIPNSEFMRVENGFHILRLSDQAEQIQAKKVEFLKAHAPNGAVHVAK